jgi:hypothetical protein
MAKLLVADETKTTPMRWPKPCESAATRFAQPIPKANAYPSSASSDPASSCFFGLTLIWAAE